MPRLLPPVVVFALAFAGCAIHGSHFLKTSDGVPIAYEKKEVPGEKGIVILVHGLGSSLEEWGTLTPFLNRNGWSTLAVDLRGHGESTEWNGEELDWRNFTDKGRLTYWKDIDAAYEAVKHHRRVWLIGASLGANLGLNYASAKKSGIEGLVLLSPGYNYGGIESRSAMKELGKLPVFIAGSENDYGIVKLCRILEKMAQGPVKVLVTKEAGHGAVMLENEETLKGEILEWLNKNTH